MLTTYVNSQCTSYFLSCSLGIVLLYYSKCVTHYVDWYVSLHCAEEPVNLNDRKQWDDINVIAGALKLFFRELVEPLIPFAQFGPFVEIMRKIFGFFYSWVVIGW